MYSTLLVPSDALRAEDGSRSGEATPYPLGQGFLELTFEVQRQENATYERANQFSYHTS